MKQVEAFGQAYCDFLSRSKTEREFVRSSVSMVRSHGFRDLDEVIRAGESLHAGDRVYRNWMGKSFMAFIVGSEPLERGMNILGAHIDSPRLDVKPNPLFENDGLAYLDTRYYGGIKKYQWLALPLALHGVIARKDGSTVDVCIGEQDSDPVFCISDLLPHLAREQMKKNAAELIDGDALDLIIASQPDMGAEKEPVRAMATRLLCERYGIEEEDLLSAELEIVPAGRARDMGIDRSMILGYAHDDRVCAYASLAALCDIEGVPKYTLCCVLTDKEEIGSVGATGMLSRYFELAVSELYNCVCPYSELGLRRTLSCSRMLSSDVSAGYDPGFPNAFEKKNAAYLGGGLCLNKYTGRSGKGDSNDANAEFIAQVRRVFDEAGVTYQMAELGRVDVGGGGTIAYICALLGMNVIDSGVAVLSMHAPWEIISKADLYEAYRGYSAFLRGIG